MHQPTPSPFLIGAMAGVTVTLCVILAALWYVASMEPQLVPDCAVGEVR